MSSDIKTLGRHTAIYAFGTALSKLASFLMLPIYTRFLTPADYGVLELMSMTIDLIGILTGATLAASVFRFYAEYKERGEENEVVSTAAIGMTTMAAVVAIIGFLAAPALEHFVLKSHGNPTYFRLFFLLYITQTAEVVPFLMCRALKRSSLVVTINLVRLVAQLALNGFFVVHLRMGVTGVLVSNLLVSAAVATGMTIFLFRQTGTAFSTTKFKEMARYAYPVAFVSAGNFFLVFSDRYFLNHYLGASVVGVYSLAYKFGFILTTFAFTPFQQIWGPQRFLVAKQENARDIYRRVFVYLNIALGILALIIALFVRDVLKVMAAQPFWNAYRIVPFVLAAQILHHWTSYNNLGLFLTKTTTKFAWGSAVAIPSVLILNYLLIPHWGIWGAITATLGAYLLRFGVMQIMSQRVYRIDYDWRRVLTLYLIIVSAVAIRIMMGDLRIVPSVISGVLLVIAVVSAVYMFILRDDERRAGRRLLERKLFRRDVPAEQFAAPQAEGKLPVAAE